MAASPLAGGAATAPGTRRLEGPRRSLRRSRWTLAALGAALLTAAGLAAACAFVLAGDGDDRPGVPVEMSAAEVRSLARASDRPVYWAGARAPTRLEVTRTAGGRTYVRYLPRGVAAGDGRPAFLTVATYPHPSAYPATRDSARRRGMVRRAAPGGGIAAWSAARPGNVYLAHPGSDVLVEVFSPTAEEAQRLTLAGEVGPIR